MIERVLEPEVMDTPEEAELYDRMDSSTIDRAFVARLIELSAGGRMLDLGTGPGHLPLAVCEAFEDASVLAVDLAGNMLALAEEHRVSSPHRDRIELLSMDIKRLDLPDDGFDTVFSNTVLHHLADPVPVLAEARRVLRPGGCLLVRDLYRPPDMPTLDRLVALYAGSEPPLIQRGFRDSLLAALTPQELAAAAAAAGLGDASIVIDGDRHMSLQLASPVRPAARAAAADSAARS